MKNVFRKLHNEMLAEIQSILGSDCEEWDKTETCFWIGCKYWEQLKELIKPRGFNNNSEEIYFFKHVKPRFTCYIEYMMMISEALLFAPDTNDEKIKFWKLEIERAKKFNIQHQSFLAYYHSKEKHLDAIYFSRRYIQLKNAGLAHAYDKDPAYSTSHDPVLRTYLAYKMFVKYAKHKLQELKKIKSENKSYHQSINTDSLNELKSYTF